MAVDMQVMDDSVSPAVAVDADTLTLSVSQIGSTSGSSVLVTDTYNAAGSQIVRTATGRYQRSFGPSDDTSVPSSSRVGDYIYVWTATVAGEVEYGTEIVRVVSAGTMRRIILLQNLLDKASKTADPDAPIGYTPGQFSQWLDGGLQYINALPPWPSWSTVDDFPFVHEQTLLEASMCVGLSGQLLFAIDTDIPNYVDNGNSFPLDHHPRLLATLQHIAGRLDQYVPKLKTQYVTSGHLHVRQGPQFRIATLVGMAPNGALFRNLFAR